MPISLFLKLRSQLSLVCSSLTFNLNCKSSKTPQTKLLLPISTCISCYLVPQSFEDKNRSKYCLAIKNSLNSTKCNLTNSAKIFEKPFPLKKYGNNSLICLGSFFFISNKFEKRKCFDLVFCYWFVE